MAAAVLMLWGSMTTVNMTIKVPAFIAEATIVMLVLSMLHKKPAKQRQSARRSGMGILVHWRMYAWRTMISLVMLMLHIACLFLCWVETALPTCSQVCIHRYNLLREISGLMH